MPVVKLVRYVFGCAQPLQTMSQHRQGESDAVMSEAFGDVIARHGVTPITYRDLLGIVCSAGRSSFQP
jgi:hypothetical protein